MSSEGECNNLPKLQLTSNASVAGTSIKAGSQCGIAAQIKRLARVKFNGHSQNITGATVKLLNIDRILLCVKQVTF